MSQQPPASTTAFDGLDHMLADTWQTFRPGALNRPSVSDALTSGQEEGGHRLALEATKLAASLGLPRDRVQTVLDGTLKAMHKLRSRDPDAAMAYNTAAGPLATMAAEVNGLARTASLAAQAPSPGGKMTVEKANCKARDLARKMKAEFFRLSPTAQAKWASRKRPFLVDRASTTLKG